MFPSTAERLFGDGGLSMEGRLKTDDRLHTHAAGRQLDILLLRREI